jgi:hypothetical protein
VGGWGAAGRGQADDSNPRLMPKPYRCGSPSQPPPPPHVTLLHTHIRLHPHLLPPSPPYPPLPSSLLTPHPLFLPHHRPALVTPSPPPYPCRCCG